MICSQVVEHIADAQAFVRKLLALGRVVVGILDPAPWVAGNGIERIRAAGLAVDVGVEAAACAAINADWIAGVVGLPDDVVDDPTAGGAADDATAGGAFDDATAS